jgi:hypothetical protein
MFQLGKPSSQKTYSKKILFAIWPLVKALVVDDAGAKSGGNQNPRIYLSKGKTLS